MPELTDQEEKTLRLLRKLIKNWAPTLSVTVYGSTLKVYQHVEGELRTKRSSLGLFPYATTVDEPDSAYEVERLQCPNWDTRAD